MKRGELWWAQLDEPVGSGPGYRRPVLIVQSDVYNRSAVRTITVLAVTSNLALAMAPGNVQIAKVESGLNKVSVVNVTQFITLDREQMLHKIKLVPPPCMQRVEQGMRAVLQL